MLTRQTSLTRTKRKLPAALAGGNGQGLFDAELALKLYELSPLGICLSDGTGGCIYANAAYLKIMGMTLEDSRGALWSGSLHPDDRKRVDAEWQEAVKAGQLFQS
ncbi:MAG: PAS domain-containing protein [Woeseiaceae bacterium]|nr:PAS domain-containing protein [Woeseiaceae bacterium]